MQPPYESMITEDNSIYSVESAPGESSPTPSSLELKRTKTFRYIASFLMLIPFILSWAFRKQVLGDVYDNLDHQIVKYANYLGDASFSITGALTAGNTGMDLLGVTIVGFVTALGGGTIRDVLLGNTPLFWLSDYDEILLCNGCSIALFYAWPELVRRWNFSTEDEWIFWSDAIGLGVFAATGAHTGHNAGVSVYGCALCGMFTATFGGLTRDLLCQRPVRVLYSTCEVYAPCGLLGGFGYTLWARWNPNSVPEALLLGTWIGITTRVIAYNHFVTLPIFKAEGSAQSVPFHNEQFDAPYLGTRGNRKLLAESPPVVTPSRRYLPRQLTSSF